MAEIKWIKLSTDIFDNRKIKILETLPDGDTLIVIWMKLLCLAGTCNDSGSISLTKEIPYTENMLSSIFNRNLSTIKLALQTFQEFEMIDIVDNFINISNWEKYQSVDKMEIIKEQNRKRVKRFREKQRLNNTSNLEICNVTSNANVTQCNAIDIDIDIDKDIDLDINLSISQETDVTLHAKRFFPEWSDRQIAIIIKLAEEYGCIQVKDAIEKVASKDGINDPISYIKKILISKDV